MNISATMTAAEYMRTDNYKASVALNWMVNVCLYRGPQGGSVHIHACPWDCLDVAARLWASVPDARSISMSIPSLGAEGIQWGFRCLTKRDS